jgi:hypothetical protein
LVLKLVNDSLLYTKVINLPYIFYPWLAKTARPNTPKQAHSNIHTLANDLSAGSKAQRFTYHRSTESGWLSLLGGIAKVLDNLSLSP